MVEYTRLISGDWLQRITNNWQRQDTVLLVVVLAVVIIIGYLVVRRR